jgi:hypothetical protein
VVVGRLTTDIMSTTNCKVCASVLGTQVTHDGVEVCPVQATYTCTQCGGQGHLASSCRITTHVRRPRTLEELIPSDVRARWGITTQTPIVWSRPSVSTMEREVDDENTIEIRHQGNNRDAKIREVMKQNKVRTAHSMEDNITRLRSWAVTHGKKIRIIQEK